MSNIYNEIHKFSFALKNCEEFIALNKAKENLGEDETAKTMVKDFFKKQTDLQVSALSGKKEDQKAKTEEINKLYEIINLNNKAKDYLAAVMKFEVIIQDLYRIVGNTAKEE